MANPLQTTEQHLSSDVPLGIRLRLCHAYFQHLAQKHDIDLLHIKGYAFEGDVYRKGRVSSDVDVLVRPQHVDRLLTVMKDDGWSILAHFETGSVFQHAMTLYHSSWGLVDIHRYFPGIGSAEGEAFDRLWEHRRERLIAGVPCLVPSLVDCQIFVIVHSARSADQHVPDVEFLESTVSEEQWHTMRNRVPELGAELGFAAAMGELEQFKDHPDYLIWKSVSQNVPVYLLWKARFQQAQGVRAKLAFIANLIRVNRDHLAMELGHSPSQREIRQKFFSRFLFWKK
ncbi:MAG: nucleotidyltransferase family protein [Rothia sp. (in: high G+C Gram-positive bacteria)]|nr:nucleotidyltransferase family protein [Rothia sp. (in: high G+C Gram-positive bacteria)]